MSIKRETADSAAAEASAKSQPPQAAHLLPIDEVFEAFASSNDGLSSEEARLRLDRYGPNQLRERKRTSGWMRLLLQFHNPLIYVLLATAGATGLLQHWVDTGVILGVVIINAIIGFIQESKAEQAIESLKEMLAPQAVVLREGAKTSLPATDLVPGDLVLIEGGDKAPADLRLVRVKNLQIDEAPLTGESMPVAKTTEALDGDVPLGDRRNLAFAGTLATSGTAAGIVIATGDDTQIGRIAGMLQDVEGVDTPLIRRLASFSKVITVIIILFCVLVFGVGVLTGQGAAEMLIAAVALAVSAIPEGLPAIMTIALAIGVKRMAARNAVIRKLPAVEALGSATVICSDKTGTLTRNEMTVTRVVCTDGDFTVTGTGYEPSGAVLDEGGQAVSPGDSPGLGELVTAGVLCNDARLRQADGQWRIEGDPTEGALLVLAGKADLSPEEIVGAWPRTDAIPFESELQYMATLHRDESGRVRIFLKGSPEAVLSRCSHAWRSDGPLEADHWRETADAMAAEGLRVLAVAEKEGAPDQTEIDLDDTERGFVLLGLVGMTDPPRPEAIDAVAKCHAAGIRVIMITGDHAATARAIAGQIGIRAAEGAKTGAELEKLDDAGLDQAVDATDVFARVAPAQKLKIVQSLQRRGHVVSMTGDGVNDAPALKQADIGVAMGVTGTDVSKEAAEMVLLDDNFASIERAVEEGRTVFNNLKKTILFILPTNGGECLTLVAALFLGTLLPILPLHILWINLVTTVALAITLAFDPVEADVMRQPPRDPQSPLIDGSLVWRIVYVSVLISLGTFGLFFYELRLGSGLEAARGVAVNAIVFFEVAYVFNSRHLRESVLNRRGLFENQIVWWGIAAVVLFQAVFTYWPVMNTLFEVAPLDAWMWLRVLAASLALMLLVELEKAVGRRLARSPAGRD
ncbi:MAG: cation-transporting P-type ATPase [Planctomycetota bacterium]|nr:MAG: cation-transporting P-type ATPase [Planctomycetota bacterium]REK22453.1 MAG: cation-transporting P-type ATPase [Planctomycetota bacterium]REK34897.1 MAG: cation-transporting P-type ATPase [Planctomycetota bacterium]